MSNAAARVRRAQWSEAFVRKLLAACAGVSVVVTTGIVFVLLRETLGFFTAVPLWDFLTGRDWAPMFEPRHFGVLPLVCGTFLIAATAAATGIPVGVGVAVFLNEYAPGWLRNFLKPVMELLAGIPTVVYGYFALTTVTPALQLILPQTEVFNALSAGLVVGLMTMPMVASLCDDALRAVPRALKDAGFALGATRYEVTTRVTVPAALSGIASSFVLAISRAFGETMAVTLAAGSTPRLTLNPLASIQTLTAYIVQVSTGDVPAGSIEYQSIFAVGTLLFVVTLVFNLLAQWLVKRFRSVYE